MDISTINDAINTLANSDTTPANVAELAALYICKANLEESLESHSDASGDVLPCYNKYRDIKRRYQLGQTNESEVIRAMKELCADICMFVDEIYSGTDMNRERICLQQMLQKLANAHK